LNEGIFLINLICFAKEEEDCRCTSAFKLRKLQMTGLSPWHRQKRKTVRRKQ